MDEQRTDDTAHTLPGPHLELHAEGLSAFAPLRLIVQPGCVSVEVTLHEAIVGRHSLADVRLAFPEVSRRHCRLFYRGGQWRIEDLKSVNGLWINGERMQEAALYDGDRVRVGGCVLMVEKGTPVRVVTPLKKSDPEMQVLRRIAEALPRQVG